MVLPLTHEGLISDSNKNYPMIAPVVTIDNLMKNSWEDGRELNFSGLQNKFSSGTTCYIMQKGKVRRFK